MVRRLLVAVAVVLAAGCGNDAGNPFDRLASSRPPSPDAALVFVSGSWTEATGQPRVLLALGADGSALEQLTSCSTDTDPCDVLQAAPSPDRAKIVAIRTTPGAEEGAKTLYYTDLARGAETVVFARRRVDAVDWSSDGSFIIFSALGPQTTQEDLFYSQPNGQAEQNLTQSTAVRERAPRIDPFGQTAVYEQIDDSGVGHISLFPDTPLTSGPATGPGLPGTPYVVGADADPVFAPDGRTIAFRRLTGVGNGGLGTWDLLTLRVDGVSEPVVIASGAVFRGAPDWGTRGILFVETDAAASRSELVLVQPDGTGRTVLRTEDAGYRMGSPRWLPGS
jgi:Tol biopolymer transport system component